MPMSRTHKPISNRLARLGGAAVSAAVLWACASHPPVATDPTAGAAVLEARSLDDPRLQQFIAATSGQSRQDWDLDRLTLAAVYFHPDLDVAYAKLAAAQATIRTARQVPNPTLSLTGQYAIGPDLPSPWAVNAAINFLVETLGKRGYRTDEARELADAARQDVTTAAWQVRARVRSGLLDLWVARRRLDLARQRLSAEDQLVGLLEHRQAIGAASSLDLARERTNRDQFAIAVTDAQRATQQAVVQLAVAVSVPARALESVDLDMSAFDHPSDMALPLNSELRRRALTGRADVQSALAQLAAAQSALQLQLAGRFPNLTLGPAYTYDKGDNEYGLSLTADLPIFNQNQGPIAEALAHRRLAAATFTSVQAGVIGAIDEASAAYRGASAGLATADALLVDQQRRQARTTRLFQAGEIDRPTWLAGDLELRAAEASRLDAELARRQALGQLEDALQTPLFGSSASLSVPQTRPREEVNR